MLALVPGPGLKCVSSLFRCSYTKVYWYFTHLFRSLVLLWKVPVSVGVTDPEQPKYAPPPPLFCATWQDREVSYWLCLISLIPIPNVRELR